MAPFNAIITVITVTIFIPMIMTTCRFSTIIVLELLTFTVAMYVTFEATPGPPPDGFEHFGVALMTMFQLMLGLSEVEVLYEASHPWVAVTLFVLFVLLTYVLVLNALIAMMSNTCSLVSEEKVVLISMVMRRRRGIVVMMLMMMRHMHCSVIKMLIYKKSPKQCQWLWQ